MLERTVVIGDVHGCLAELKELLAKVEFRAATDRLVFVGDLVDRGPDPVGVARFVRLLQTLPGVEYERPEVVCVLGNHEEKHVRWAKHEANRVATGKANPMKQFPEKRLAEHNALSGEDRAWLAALPAFIRLKTAERDWIITHAGVPTDKPIEQQDYRTLCRTRYVDRNSGKYASTGNAREVPPDAVPWYMRWAGPESVVYGHDVPDLKEPRITGTGKVVCFGIDTGCVFGGHLTALVINAAGITDLVQVKAHETYWEKDWTEWRE